MRRRSKMRTCSWSCHTPHRRYVPPRSTNTAGITVTSNDQIKAELYLLETHVLNKIGRPYFDGYYKVQIARPMGANRIQSGHKNWGLTYLMYQRKLRGDQQPSEAV